MKRRDFISATVKSGLALSVFGLTGFEDINTGNDHLLSSFGSKDLFFKLSLAEWSLHKALFSKKIDHLDFAAIAAGYNFEGVEYVNTFFKDKAGNKKYLNEMNHRVHEQGIKNVLIMIDNEGNLADPDANVRTKAIENHYKWVEAAHFLNCHAIRVNLRGGKDPKEAAKASVDSLNRLSDFAKGSNISILVENHGGYTSDGNWMTEVFSQVKNQNCGTLPDFGNFCIRRSKNKCTEQYDTYKGMAQLLVFAKAVSAKSHNFDSNGNERDIDYYRIMKMVKETGYSGFVGVEFEGEGIPEEKGILLTRDLLIKVGRQLS